MPIIITRIDLLIENEMTDSNYAKESDPLSTLNVEMRIMSDRIGEMQKTMKEVSKLPMQVEKLNITVEQFQRDHETTKASLKATQIEVSDLNRANTRIDTIKNIVQFGGIATFCAIGGAWLALSDKADTANAKATMNEQKIIVLEKNQDQLMRTQEDIRMRLYQRESMSPIITPQRGQNEAY